MKLSTASSAVKSLGAEQIVINGLVYMAENEMDKRGYNSKLELLGAHFDGWVFRGHVVPSLKLTACLPLEI